jgi:hypothetical protein
MNQPRTLTHEQHEITAELTGMHGLDPSQISFEGNDLTPIFDFEAVCLLSLKLTDIREIVCEITSRDFDSQIVTARCSVRLPDGRTRVCEDSARMHEPIGDGSTIDSLRMADNVAQARAVRRGIRSVGINLWHAHKKFKDSGRVAMGHTRHDPRKPLYEEIHVLAVNLGLIVAGDKEGYKSFLAETYDGRTSARDLDDAELQRFLISLRAMNRMKRAVSQNVA